MSKGASSRYGEGRVYEREEASGAVSFYGRWYAPDGRRVHRKLGWKRSAGRADGLTVAQAKAELRRRMEADQSAPIRPDRITFGEAADRALDHFATRSRRPIRETTATTYRTIANTHLRPALGNKSAASIDAAAVTSMLAGMRGEGKSAKTIQNAYRLAHSIFAYAVEQGWRADNPCADVEAPTLDPSTEVRFLNESELEALLRAAAEGKGEFAATDHALYMAAAMAGLRQGELLALRVRHVDFAAERIHVRLSYVRGVEGPPKSARGAQSPSPPPSPPSSRVSYSATTSPTTTTAFSATRRLATCSTTPPSSDASRPRSNRRGSARRASTICATRSGRAWRALGRRWSRFKIGWVTRSSRRPKSTPTTRHAGMRPRWLRRHSRRRPIRRPILNRTQPILTPLNPHCRAKRRRTDPLRQG